MHKKEIEKVVMIIIGGNIFNSLEDDKNCPLKLFNCSEMAGQQGSIPKLIRTSVHTAVRQWFEL